MNENVKAKIEALRADHQAHKDRLAKMESSLNDEAKTEFNLIKDDVLARVLFDIDRFGSANYRYRGGDYLDDILQNNIPLGQRRITTVILINAMILAEGLTLTVRHPINSAKRVVILPKRDTL